jgi:ATP-dependent Clp protease ATP-binding subunit ClpC
MFEKYNEKARRILFFARYEASQMGSSTIEIEHLLLGLLRENQGIISRLISGLNIDIKEIRRVIYKNKKEIQPPSATKNDLPLSSSSKRSSSRASSSGRSTFFSLFYKRRNSAFLIS